MPDLHKHYSQFIVKADGQYVTGSQKDAILSVVVEQSVHLPASAVLVFRDTRSSAQDPLNLGLTNQNILPIGTSLEIEMGMEATPASVFKGEVTAHEVDVRLGSVPMLIVRGFDRAHRLQRGRASTTFLNVTDSDIASRIASSAGLTPQVESTSQVHPYVLQNNQTNWEFLQDRARRNGYEVFVDDKKLVFRKPKATGAAQISADLWSQIMHINLRMTSAGQINGVTVKGWDPKTKAAITGNASTGQATSGGGQQQSGSTIARPFGSSAKMIVARKPVASQAEADNVAQAVADDLAGGAMYLEAEMPGNPSLQAGQLISLDKLGPRFNGHYYVTSVTHRYSLEQIYTTKFEVGGRRASTLLDLVSAPNTQQNGHAGGDAVVVGLVTDNKDPDDLGKVKVKFPWLDDQDGTKQIESTWARLVAPSAGAGRGMFWIPEINDEVLIAFEHGDVHRPFVLGALWNGTDAAPKKSSEAVDGGTSKVNLRVLKSRSGHTITLDDTESTENITVLSKSGHTIKLDDPSGSETITIKDKSGNNSFVIETSSNKITITAMGNIELKATQDVNISGMNVSIKAETQATVEGTVGAEIKGATCKLTGDTLAQVSSTTSAQISGGASTSISGAAISLGPG